MTFDEMMSKVLNLFPDALVNERINGEIFIETGMKIADDRLVTMDFDND